ncbi:uncharacterized protein [Oryza sativa Japonica Group]|nr:uncharacterized protein LOC107277189 [Oryza sativa Japonica Group]KAB8101477.1 hypothetical protein EE612_032296 [Oryza sativa]KAF2925497.1 hypothetical protein DAI22_06g057300 [Oryza sativa Japonica Group]BAS96474.1 Os06g0181800 [Oryza sativa Japonica Group]
MPLACFAARGGGGAGASSSSSPAPAASATSVYWTHLGTVTLTWSRGQLGLVLAAELHLAGEGAAPALRFLLRPLLPWRRRGCKRFAGGGHAVAFTWDMSRARLAGRRPEPVARYSLHVCVDGELVLAAGDLALLAPSAGFLLTRRENAVAAGGGEAYATTVAVAGGRHEVSIAVEDAVMWVAIDGEKALQVRRLRWKFRGSERLDLPRGRVRVSWDLHGWLFAADAVAVFVLRFETADVADTSKIDMERDAGMLALRQSSFNRKHHHHGGGGGAAAESWCSSDSDRRGWRRGPFRSGSDSSPAVSVASTSAASSAGSMATVADWATAEEAAMNDGGGFSLVVHLWKTKKRR